MFRLIGGFFINLCETWENVGEEREVKGDRVRCGGGGGGGGGVLWFEK